MKTSEHYTVIESTQYADGKAFTSYGIKGKDVIFEDISTDRQKVEEMAERINREELEECHFMYFIQDEIDR